MTFSESVAASGGYWLLCIGKAPIFFIFKGDEVYAQPSTIVGNIGVVFLNANLKSFLEKRKIEVKYTTSKDSDKGPDFARIFNRFSDSCENDNIYINNLLKEISVNFKDHVMKYRKFTCNDIKKDEIFNANAYLGEEAKTIGYSYNL